MAQQINRIWPEGTGGYAGTGNGQDTDGKTKNRLQIAGWLANSQVGEEEGMHTDTGRYAPMRLAGKIVGLEAGNEAGW
jgi:hypothetical protein